MAGKKGNDRMTTDTMIAVAIFAALFLGAGAFGFCGWCKNFTNEREHGEFEGGFRYVADQEHDADGKALTGWRLEFSRRMEQLFFPPCYVVNKLLGRENTSPAPPPPVAAAPGEASPPKGDR
jgi:hypothetical protein